MKRGTREQLSPLYLALAAGGERESTGATSLGPGTCTVCKAVPVLQVMLSPGPQAGQLGQKFLQGAETATAGKWPKMGMGT